MQHSFESYTLSDKKFNMLWFVQYMLELYKYDKFLPKYCHRSYNEKTNYLGRLIALCKPKESITVDDKEWMYKKIGSIRDKKMLLWYMFFS